MKYPNWEEEKILWEKGFKYVAGLDEAGRGPLAGPVTAAAVIFDKNKIEVKKTFNEISNLMVKSYEDKEIKY